MEKNRSDGPHLISVSPCSTLIYKFGRTEDLWG